MKLKSTIPYSHLPQNQQYIYELSAMGGVAEALVTFLEDDRGRKVFHLKCTASIKILNLDYHFECLSRWEAEKSILIFDSYEEKDFSKKIKKKWELNPDGLNYIENKKGLVLEREVIYFPDKEIENIFDPLSAAIQFMIDPLAEKEERHISIFGKQRILELIAKKDAEFILIEPIQGINVVWTKLLSQLRLKFENNYIKEAKIPSPLQFGTLHLKIKEIKNISVEEATQILEQFNS